MQATRTDAHAARSQLAAHGWIARGAESFRHLPPGEAALWLGEDGGLAAWDEVDALADGWALLPLPATAADAFHAHWLDASDPVARAELFDGLGAPADDEAAPFAWAHRALVRQGLRLRVTAGATAFLSLRRRPCRAVEAPLLAIELQEGARCVLLERHAGDATRAAVQNLHVHVRLGEGASLQHVRHVAPLAADRVAHHLHVHLEREARYDQCLLASGSGYHLQRNVFDLDGEGAVARAAGVLLAAGSTLEQQVLVRHAAPRTRSAAEVLALASGAARVVANARTRIAAGCDDAETRQRLAGIPTAGQPRIVLRPHLEIHHDQVQAAHGATWGALPEEALFHARQRGLDEQAAKALIVEGLARAVLARAIDDEPLPSHLRYGSALAAAVGCHLRASAKESPHG